jgi:hypothetical protein
MATVHLAHDLRHDRRVALSRGGRSLMTPQAMLGSAHWVFVAFH